MSSSIMFIGTGSNAGKTVFTRSISRALSNRGHRTAPFKAVTVGTRFEQRGNLTLDFRMWILAEAARFAATPYNAPVQAQVLAAGVASINVLQRDLGEAPLLAPDSVILASLGTSSASVATDAVIRSIERLRRTSDVLVIEGAGNPIDLADDDLANIFVARQVQPAIVLVGNIGAGGAISGIVGTYSLLPEDVRPMVIGFALNDPLRETSESRRLPARIEKESGLPCLGVFPHCTFYDNIPPGQHSSLESDEAEYEMLSSMFDDFMNLPEILAGMHTGENPKEYDLERVR
jgi:adenosylcobyric acid synthase